MKDKALYHLLVARLHDLRRDASPEAQAVIDKLCSSLRVEYTARRYRLDWCYRGDRFQLELPHTAVSFYVRGDVKGPQRTTTQRWENWRQAKATVEQMAETSGISELSDTLAKPTGSASDDPERGRLGLAQLAGLALGTGAVTWVFSTSITGLWTAVAVFFMLALGIFQRQSLLGKRLNWPEAGVISAGGVLPAALGASPVLAALAATTLSALCMAEARGAVSTRLEWAGAGILAATPVLWAGRIALPVPFLTAVLLIVVHLLMPNRIARGKVGAFVLASAIGTGIASVPAIAASGASHAALTFPAGMLIWVTIALATLLLLTWWVPGQQYTLFPWFSFLFIAVTGAAAVMLQGGSEDALSFLAFFGFLLVSSFRVITALLEAHAPRALT